MRTPQIRRGVGDSAMQLPPEANRQVAHAKIASEQLTITGGVSYVAIVLGHVLAACTSYCTSARADPTSAATLPRSHSCLPTKKLIAELCPASPRFASRSASTKIRFANTIPSISLLFPRLPSPRHLVAFLTVVISSAPPNHLTKKFIEPAAQPAQATPYCSSPLPCLRQLGSTRHNREETGRRQLHCSTPSAQANDQMVRWLRSGYDKWPCWPWLTCAPDRHLQDTILFLRGARRRSRPPSDVHPVLSASF